MKKLIQNSLRGLMLVPALALVLSFAAPAVVGAQPYTIGGGADAAQGDDHSDSLFGNAEGETGIFTTITNILLFIIGAVAVIMLVIGGIRYTISGGDSNAVTAAKNTILYAVIGIVVAILAYAIVNFVIVGLVNQNN